MNETLKHEQLLTVHTAIHMGLALIGYLLNPRYYCFNADIDECNLSVSQCLPDSHCENTIGSYLCICNVGYSGDGFVNCTSKFIMYYYIVGLYNSWMTFQTLMSVTYVHTTVTRMLSAQIPLVVSHVLATLDILEMEHFAVSPACIKLMCRFNFLSMPKKCVFYRL